MAALSYTPQRELLRPGPDLRILQAMVDTLLDGAPPELAAELREDLPDPLKGTTKAYNEEAPANVDEFLERFRRRAGLDRKEDILHKAQIAVGVVDSMLAGDTVDDLLSSFPVAFGILFRRVADG